MSDSTNFSGTITGGVQDISALLPLLGTEQCEKHVGSALDRGFLYSSVTPISIFGSLGLVRAAFNIVIACFNIRRHRCLGARKLSDGGFGPNGVVAPMIALDPKHPKRFLAETRLESMLTEEHMENAEDLTVSWGQRIVWWNFFLITSTLVISSTGLVPYIGIVLDSHNQPRNALFPLGFGFPILRVVGSAACVSVAQLLIQIRILVILKKRLLFIAIDRLAKEAHINLENEINATMERKKAKSAWNSEVASEKCIWALRTWLATIPDQEKRTNHQTISTIYDSQYRRQMKSIDTHVPRWVTPLLVCCLILGCLSTVVGYIGCFYLIQHTASSTGTLLWLLLEALLSIVRILVWAINPSWDDSEGIVFELQLASHAPLITCNKFESDFLHDGVAPLTRSDRFLEEVVAYTGPFPAFSVPDVALYYIRTAKSASASENNKTPSGMLYIVLSDHKEQTSRILFKKTPQDAFSIYSSSLEPVPRSTAINVRVDFSEEGKTESDTHFLTSDAVFMARLGAHYDEINLRIQKQRCNTERKAHFGKTWAMQRPSTDDDGEDVKFPSSGDNAPRLEAKDVQQGNTLTVEDMTYLRHGQVERRWHDMYKQLEEWIGLFIALYTKELLKDVPADLFSKKDESVTIVQKYETNETEFLLIECSRMLELLLIFTARKWDNYMRESHGRMVKDLLRATFNLGHIISAAEQQHNEGTRQKNMKTRLTGELESLLEKERRTRRDSRRNRLTAQMESTNRRIHERKYTDAAGEAIMSTWKTMSGDKSSEVAEISNSVLETGSVVSLTAEANRARIAKARADFQARMCARYEEAVKNVNNCKDDIVRRKQLSEVEQMDVRCRQRADQLFLRLESQMAEFADLHTKNVLIADKHEFVDYWSDKSLQERLRLQDRTQRYLKLTDASTEAVGGPQNMLRALRRSQKFLFIDSLESNLLMGEEVKSVISSVESVTGAALWRDSQETYKVVVANVRAAVGVHCHDTCLYTNLVVSNHERTGKPYLLFAIPGASSCNVYFYIQVGCDHTITLRHCVTMRGSKLIIKLNGYELNGTWGQTRAVQSDFTNEDIHLPKDYLGDLRQPNVLEIILDDGVYWLSDIFLPVRPVQV